MSGKPRRVRVLHVLKYYRPTFTGEGVFLERCAGVMQELAPSVEHELLVTHTPAPRDLSVSAASSSLLAVHYLTRGVAGAVRRHLALVLWFFWHLRRFDVVHLHTHADWYFLSYALARLFGRRLLLSATLDDSLPNLIAQYRERLRPLARRGFNLIHAFISISPKLHDETRSLVPEDRCRLIPCGILAPPQAEEVRQAMRERIGAGPDTPVILFVGGLCARKDPLSLVRILPGLRSRHPGTRLVLIGPPLEPDYVAELVALAERTGVADAIVFAGEQADPHPWFAAADILAFPSRLEGFGTVVAEAMAHGLPVVVRRLPGVNEDFVIDGETGFAFEDEAGLIQGLDRLIGDAALRRRLGDAARSLARRRFDMRAIAADYLRAYGCGAHILSPDPEALETPLAGTASVLDRRFHTPLQIDPETQPLLITTVDAEESFDWSSPFSRTATDVRSMSAQERAHRVFDRHGVVPIYLADYPVVTQPEGYRVLQELLAEGRCEIGAQLHPWVTPPFLEELSDRNSYVANLPSTVEHAKAARLTEAIRERFGVHPLMYRTGLYGGSLRTGDILRRLGYRVDSSLSVCWPPLDIPPHAKRWVFSARPAWIDRDCTLLELPVSAGLVGSLPSRIGAALAPLAFSRYAEDFGVAAALARLRLLERIRLSPEGITLEEAKRLVRAMLADGHRVFVLTYHSPSLVPGGTPYTRSEEDVRRFLDWLDAFYTFFREEVGGRMGGWRDALPQALTNRAGKIAA